DSAILGELNSYVQHPNIKDRIINCLLGVDGSYTKVFNGKVLGETFSETDKADLIANATGKYGFKANFQNSLELCVYDPLVTVASAPQGVATPPVPQPTPTPVPQGEGI